MESRTAWIKNSLQARAAVLRKAAKDCRAAYKKSYMGEPANYIADAYDEAAQVIEDKIPLGDFKFVSTPEVASLESKHEKEKL